MYTFKAQAKSNAKRFLTKTCKVSEHELDQYLIEHAEHGWGTFTDEAGQPARHQVAYAALRAETGLPPAGMVNEAGKAFGTAQRVAELPTEDSVAALADAGEQPEEDADDDVPPPSALGAFAMAQLTAPAGTPQPEAAPLRSRRESNKPAGSVKIEKNRDVKNGVTRPSAGTVCMAVWELCGEMTAKKGSTIALSELVPQAMTRGINQFTARTQYARWRSFNGITNRVTRG